jgi:hypothetical protein
VPRRPPKPKTPLRLMRIAALARAQGLSWAAAAGRVKLKPETVQNWPEAYPNDWERIYARAVCDVRADATAETIACLRQQLRSDDPKVVLGAGQQLLRGVPATATLPDANLPDDDLLRLAHYARSLSDADLARAITDADAAAGGTVAAAGAG